MPLPHPSRRDVLAGASVALLTGAVAQRGGAATAAAELAADPRRPANVVLIYCDDMGYADLGCYGSKTNPTPNIDALASSGVRFTDFYVAQAVCTASRAALLTGCYPNRVGLFGAIDGRAKIGLNPDEFTIARAAKKAGLATALFGKWHLGHHPSLLPPAQGFDEFFGVPYSHDMWPRHPENPRAYADLPLIEGTKTLRVNPEPGELTSLVTARALDFIERNHARPFFLYVPHPLPHVPLGVSKAFEGKTGRGLYADVIAEIDDSVGRILAALRKHDIEDRTLVIFASDNGPWTTYGDHAGDAGPLREAKGTTFEGGVRVPFIARGPGVARGAVCTVPSMTINVLPTLARLWGVELPKDRIIDGRDMTELLSNPATAKAPNEALFFYWGQHLQAVRQGRWKLHFPHDYRMAPEQRATGGRPNKARVGRIEESLFDLEKDPGETTNVIAAHPDVAARLRALADAMRHDLGDSAARLGPRNARPPGKAP